MEFGLSFLRSKIARRFFLLFVCCALLPMVALTALSFKQVTRQLTKQSHRRLQSETKAYGMSVYERLLLLDADLEVIAHALAADVQVDIKKHLGKRFLQRFKIISLYTETTGFTPILGQFTSPPPPLTRAELKNIKKNITVIKAQPVPDQTARFFMIKPAVQDLANGPFLFAELQPAYVWGIGSTNFLPAQTELVVLDMTKKVLISSHPVRENMIQKVALRQNADISRQFEYKHDNDIYLASYWSIFLASNFFAQDWIVILGQSKTAVLQPLADFNKIFPMVVLLSLWIVLLFSIIFIKKTLAPLEILKDGTRRLARKDFSQQVRVESGDEFEDLARSFNSMSMQLDQHFKTMITRGEIDRAILSSLDSGQIINTALTRMHDFLDCDLIGFSLINALQESTAQLFFLEDRQQITLTKKIIKISRIESEQLAENKTALLLEDPALLPGYLAPFKEKGFHSFLILPLFLQKKLAGFITLGNRTQCILEDEKLQQLQHLTDQLAVALSNAQLIEDMEHLTLGTIEALARTVDAKSSWTSGHSERVAAMALKIAQAMGRTEKEIETLHRGGLLHDIGKIGIPQAILDKPGKLTDEEYGTIKDHPSIGARILDPISAYADVIPMVVQHHERYDGKGYPAGLAGEEIDINSRILAVADVYDALVSNRPYRQGWLEDRAVNLLKEEAGRQFDPQVIDAFLGILATSGKRMSALTGN